MSLMFGARTTAITISVAGSFLLSTSYAQATSVAQDFSIKLSNSQIDHGIIFNDVWTSPTLSTGVEPILLAVGDTYEANITFDKSLRLDDGSINGDESIKFLIGDTETSVWAFDYEFLFTGVSGGPI